MIIKVYVPTHVNIMRQWKSTLKHAKLPSFFSRDQLKSLGSHEECCKVFLGKTIRHHLRIHDTTRKPVLEYYDSCFSQDTIQNMKKYPAFSRCLRARPACAHSSLQARRGEFVMSRCHARGFLECEIRLPW